jgi:hypothetical protein
MRSTLGGFAVVASNQIQDIDVKIKRFKNSQPLLIRDYNALQTIDLTMFPEITDFTIQTEATKKFGLRLFFASPTHGLLASFPWWDHVDRDIATWSRADIPIGTMSKPYFDLEQEWHMVIFQKRHHVYVLQGKDPAPGYDHLLFFAWFRVLYQTYSDAWAMILSRWKQSA